jgi:hypothetical protein
MGMSEQRSFTSSISETFPVALILGLFVASLHVGLASIYIDHPPHYDEMYHMLAAESWSARGELRILDGEYRRAALFTKLVALNSGTCGTSLECARWISVAASALLVMLVTVFSGIVMRPAVGLIAGMLLAVNPSVIVASQMVRFYSLHALSFFVFATLLFFLFSTWRQLSMASVVAVTAVGAGAVLLAHHLHVITELGVLGAVMGIAIILVPDFHKWLRRQAAWVVVLTTIVALGAAALLVYSVDVLAKMASIRTGPVWAQGLEVEHLFYHRALSLWYAALWPMLPLLAILSIAKWPKVSLYSLAMFGVAFLVLSTAAAKADRYLLFSLPFLVIPMAAGIVLVLQLIIDFLKRTMKKSTGWSAGASGALAAVVVLGALVPYVGTQQVSLNIARMVWDSGYVRMFGNYGRYADWAYAAEPLRELTRPYPIILSSSGVKAAYYLGDFSFELNTSVVRETDTRGEFGLDSRTGRQVVSSPESIRKIVEECGSLLVIAEEIHFDDADTLSFLDEIGKRVAVTANMWVWTVDSQRKPTAVGSDRGVAGAMFDCRPVGWAELRSGAGRD